MESGCTVTSETECAKFKALPDVCTNMKCCTQDNCNAPDPQLDPTTKIIPTSPGAPN